MRNICRGLHLHHWNLCIELHIHHLFCAKIIQTYSNFSQSKRRIANGSLVFAMRNLCRGSQYIICAKLLIIWTCTFRSRFKRFQPITNKNCQRIQCFFVFFCWIKLKCKICVHDLTNIISSKFSSIGPVIQGITRMRSANNHRWMNTN